MAHQADQQTMQLVLIRHGESEWNKLNLFTGWTDVELTDTGREEAAAGGRASKKRASTSTSATPRVSSAQFTPSTSCSAKWIASGCPSSNPGSSTSATTVRCRVSTRPMPPRSTATNRCSSGAAPSISAAGTRAERARDPHTQEQYRDVAPDQLPYTECLKDTIARAWPYFEDEIRPQMLAGKRVLIAAHGNSLRSLVMKLEHLTPEEILKVNIPTGVPLVYTFDTDFNVLDKRYIGDPATIAAKIDAVANQGKAHK